MFSFKLISSAVVVLILAVIAPIPFTTLHPDTGLTIVEMVPKHGYPLERHSVETVDGYILELHRIPHGIKGKRTGRPILLMHGLLGSSADWVVQGPQKSLAYLLADRGFDVWMGNFRGNTWSRRHKSIDPDDDPQTFYDFSFHELGLYDLPAKIDYILNATENRNLLYVGHSQGCITFLIMNSERSEYNDKIRSMYALAPAVYMKHCTSFVFTFPAHHPKIFDFFTGSLGLRHEYLPHNNFWKKIAIYVCGNYVLKGLCSSVYGIIGGHNPSQWNSFLAPVTVSINPSGSAAKQTIHYGQLVRSGKFAKFDFGSEENLAKYAQNTPPDYDLNKVTAPVTIVYSLGDKISNYTDVENLAKRLPNLVDSKLLSMPEFSHFDFLWATDIVDLLNNGIVAEMDKLNP